MTGPKHVQDARRHLEKTALKYARIKTFGADLEERQLNDGTTVMQWNSYDLNDASVLARHQLALLGDAACMLLRELAVRDEPKSADEAPPFRQPGQVFSNPYACFLPDDHEGEHNCQPLTQVLAAAIPNRCPFVY